MTKEIITNNNTYLFVEIPNDAIDFHYDSWFTRYINHSKGGIKLDVNTEIISTTKDITEEQKLSIIEEHPSKFKNGTENYEASFRTLIQTNGLDINRNYLILRKK